jgi:hypothetical protein
MPRPRGFSKGTCRPTMGFPQGEELYQRYLEPLAATPELSAVVETHAYVASISRQGLDKVVSGGREKGPFELRIVSGNGSARRDLARAVLDASGTWTHQNPVGADGLSADGRRSYAIVSHMAFPMSLPLIARLLWGGVLPSSVPIIRQLTRCSPWCASWR